MRINIAFLTSTFIFFLRKEHVMTDDRTKAGKDIDSDVDKYFYYLNMITENARNGYDYMVIKYCALSLSLIPSLIEKVKMDFGEFDITTIPAIELGAKIWSFQGNEEGVKQIEHLVESYPELSPWRIHIDRAYEQLKKLPDDPLRS